MIITSYNFFLFCAAVLIGYHSLPNRWKKYWLLGVSLWFYRYWSLNFVLIGVLTASANYFFGIGLEKAQKGKRSILWLGIIVNILAWGYFKYFGFFIEDLGNFLSKIGISIKANGLNILLPIGLSYYILQGISYLLDIWYGRVKAQKDIAVFGLYMLYFPKLIAGPVESPRVFIPKIINPKQVDNNLFAAGSSLILLGLVRKLVFADPLTALLPPDAFTSPENYPGQFLVWWVIMYAFSLYNDFAGYTNIVRGVSLYFGIELTSNFKHPYFSHNFTEFWQRWHISLSIWLRDYIFFPTTRALMKVTNKRNHIFNIVLPPMVTMLVSGIWHGGTWNMLVWGGLHGLYQVGERLLALRRPVGENRQPTKWQRGFSMSLVFGLSAAAWIPFSMEIGAAGDFLKVILSPTSWVIPDIPRVIKYIVLTFSIPEWESWLIPNLRILIPLVLSLGLDVIQERKEDEVFFLRWGKWQQAGLLAAAILAIFFATGASGMAPFVYQAF